MAVGMTARVIMGTGARMPVGMRQEHLWEQGEDASGDMGEDGCGDEAEDIGGEGGKDTHGDMGKYTRKWVEGSVGRRRGHS